MRARSLAGWTGNENLANLAELMTDTKTSLLHGGTQPTLYHFINLYLLKGEFPSDQRDVVSSIESAARVSRYCKVVVLVRASKGQRAFFNEYFSTRSDLFRVSSLPPRSSDRKLPLLADILSVDLLDREDRAQPLSEDVWCLYSNADIGVTNIFYDFVALQLMLSKHGRIRPAMERHYQGNELPASTFFINRKDSFHTEGKYVLDFHLGYDCFVFPASLLNSLFLSELSIGMPGVGSALALNLVLLSPGEVNLYNSLLLTIHTGDGRNSVWKAGNTRQINAPSARDVVQHFAASQGVFSLLKAKYVGIERGHVIRYLPDIVLGKVPFRAPFMPAARLMLRTVINCISRSSKRQGLVK